MSKIKPTEVITPKIVERRLNPWPWIVAVALLALWTWQVLAFGERQGGHAAATAAARETGLETRIAELEKEKVSLTAHAARLERASQIDRAAVESIQAEVTALQEERATLKREVAFMKALVSGEATEELWLEKPRLVDAGDGRFVFDVTLTKPPDDDDTVTGRVVIEVIGKAGGKTERVDMKSLTKGSRTNIGIRFKNYQRLSTDMVLPEDFQPEQIEVAVEPSGDVYKAFKKLYEWDPGRA
jgi:hypothetical protein